jgi:hypothetical protein
MSGISFNPMNTRDGSTDFVKTLLVAPAGFGKTTQAKHFQREYGPGFIISGESGLSSVRSAGIDYLPFSSFDGEVNPSQGIYSFTSIVRLMRTPEFVNKGYKWIMLDSITELSDLAHQWANARATREAAEANKKLNGFDVWDYYNEAFIGGCKFIRDLPYYVVLSALEKDSKNENDDEIKLPLVQGGRATAQLPGLFDNVLYGVLMSAKEDDGNGGKRSVTKRYIVTGSHAGRNGKVRDEHRACALIEEITEEEGIVPVLRKIAGGNK